MTSVPTPGPDSGLGGEKRKVVAEAAAHRRMLDDVFGDVLPDTTTDEKDAGASDGFSEQWYRDNRPPHHG